MASDALEPKETAVEPQDRSQPASATEIEVTAVSPSGPRRGKGKALTDDTDKDATRTTQQMAATSAPRERPAERVALLPIAPRSGKNSQRSGKRGGATSAAMTSRFEFYGSLPVANQLLLGSGALLALGCVIATVGPPAGQGVATAVRPYTASGRRETCLANLKSIGQAMALYASDFDGRYPLLEKGVAAKGAPAWKRTTWVTLLGDRVNDNTLSCPLQPVETAQAAHLSSYALNPVLSGFASSQLSNLEETLLIADRGRTHDVSLLPPFPSWPLQAGASAAERNPSNIDFRHDGNAGVLYADGHAQAQPSGDWLKERDAWGGGAVVPVARERIEAKYPLLAQVEKLFAAGQEAAGLEQMRQKRKEVHAATQPLLALWKINEGTGRDEELERLGWRWAQRWSRLGESGIEGELNSEESRRSQGAIAGSRGERQIHSSDWGFAVESPASWTVTPETDEGYQNTYLRSSSSHIWVLIERGTRAHEGEAAPIQWQGMERELRKRYGALYRRQHQTVTELSGEAAGDWEYEVQRADEPRLRRWYIGVSHPWESYIIACTAPAADFEACRPLFTRIVKSFRFQ